MFEQLNMTKKLKRQLGKAVSIVLSAAMLVTALPADLLGGVASVSAEESTPVIKTATSGAIDDSYFTLTSGATDDNGNSKKTYSLDGTKVKSNGRIKLGGVGGDSTKNSILFTVSTNSTAKVEVWSISGDSTNDSMLALYKVKAQNETADKKILEVDSYATKSETAGYKNNEYGKDANPIICNLSQDSLTGGSKYYLATPSGTSSTIYYLRVTETSSGGGNGDDKKDPSVSNGDVSDGDPYGDGEDEKPDADGFYDGFKAKDNKAVEGRSYVFDFTDQENLSGSFKIDGKKLENSVTKGLFAYEAGQNEATYHSTQHGIEFKETNKLTFNVAGDSYIVVGGNNNSNADLTASSSTTGTVTPATISSKTTGQASLADCKTKGDNTCVFEYKGSEGQVTLTVGAQKAYIAYVCIISNKGEETDPNAGKKQEVAVTVTSGSLVTATDKVVLVNTADASDAVVVADGKANLTVGGSYIALVQDADGNEKEALTVRINGNRKFAMTSQTTAITVTVTEPKKDAEGNPEATRTTIYNTFEKGKTPTVGKPLPDTDKTTSGILYVNAGSSSGCSYDGQLRFRLGVVLYLPIQDDTTKVTFSQNASDTKEDRITFIGKDGQDSSYQVSMKNEDADITISDITDLIVVKDGQKYLPIESNGDVKLNSITLTEYNPINTVVVSGKIADAAGKDITSIKFKNLTDEKAEIISADVKEDGTYTVELRRVNGDTTYVASIPALNYKLNGENEANQLKLTGNGATATKDFTLTTRALSTVSGTIKGIPDTGIVGEGKTLEVTLVPNDAAEEPVKLELTKGTESSEVVYTFSKQLEQGAGYKAELTNADDYEVKDGITIKEAATDSVTLTATLKTRYTVSGKFVTSDGEAAAVTKLTFTNMETPDYTYDATVTDGTYTIELREAEYVASVEAVGYTAYDHVSVAATTDAIANDVYLQGAVDKTPVTYKETIKVGAGDGKDFEKIADAIAYIARMERTADQRVTIVLDEGATYREQLVIDTPNITIQGNGSTITWYYGVGFSYYSAKKDGNYAYYDEAYAVDKYNKQVISQNPGHWGATVNLHAGAKGFAAEDLTFENSLNYYVTPEELADGASTNATAGVTARAEGIDVFAKAAKERACVLYIQADETAYKDCKFLSEQDTLYTGDGSEHSYFVNCTLEGNTDYICGDGNAVFDQCTLSMYSYSDQVAEGSYITANKKVAQHGYLLKGSKIVSVKSSATQERKAVKDTYLGRAWAAGNLYWIDTEVESADTIIAAGYKDMNEAVKDAHYYEYNTYYLVGDVKTPVDTSARAEGVTIMTDADAAKVLMSEFFDGWKPPYYEGAMEVGTITVDVTAPTAGGDVTKTATNSTPGIKDVSEITWYEGTATTAYTGETFKAETTYKAQMTVTIDDGFVFAANLTAVVDGADSATAVASADGKTATITATYTTGEEGPKGTLVTLDLTEGLKAGQTYEGGFSVLEDMPRKSANNEIAGVPYTFYVAGSSNAEPKNGDIPTKGAALKLVALADGILTVAVTVNGTKALHFVDADDIGANNKPKDYINRATSVEAGELFELNVVKGHTYYLYGDGTKMKLCAVSVLYTGELEPDTPDNPDDPSGEVVSGDGWDKNVADPVIGDVTYVKGKSAYGDGNDKYGDGNDKKYGDGDDVYGDGEDKIIVPVTADVSNMGGEKLVVTVEKVGSTSKAQTQTTEEKQKQHTFTFVGEGAGKYKITATLKRNPSTTYKDKVATKTVEIGENGQVTPTPERTGLYVELLDDVEGYTYTGSAIKPAIAVWNGDVKLTEGTDYTVKYSNNVKAALKTDRKAPTITITGKGKYTGKTTQTFNIKKKLLAEAEQEGSLVVGGLMPDGTTMVVVDNAKVSPVMAYNGTLLKLGDKKDFTVSIAKAKKAEHNGAQLTITGKTNFDGTLTYTLDVREKSELEKVSSVEVNKTIKYTYNGEVQEPTITAVKTNKKTVLDASQLQYVVVYSGDKTSAGTQKFTVIGMGLYTGSKSSSYKISPKKAENLVLTNDLEENGKVSCEFNSAGVTFNDSLTITDPEIDDLVLGKDYKVSYSGNKKVGEDKAKYTITFLGNYKGTGKMQGTFSITAADLSTMEGLEIISPDKVYNKKAVYKSAPYVLIDNVLLKSSNYKVQYFIEDSNGEKAEMTSKNKLEMAAGETATVYVKVSGKGNYKGDAEGTFSVTNDKTGKTDISKAKVSFKEATGTKKQTKVEYTGEEVYPDRIAVKVGKNPETIWAPDTTGDWDSDGYSVRFINNVEKGKATVIVTGTDGNIGSKTATYSIVSRNLKTIPEGFWNDISELTGLKNLLGL